MKINVEKIYRGFLGVVSLIVRLAIMLTGMAFYLAFITHHKEFLNTLSPIFILAILITTFAIMIKLLMIDWFPNIMDIIPKRRKTTSRVIRR